MTVALLNTNTMLLASGGASANSGTNLTVSGGGSNVCAVAVIGYENNAVTITGVTLGGTAMVSAGGRGIGANSPNFHAEAFVLVNPPTGTPALAITMSGTEGDIYYNLVVFQGVNQTTPVRGGTYKASTAGGGALPGSADGAGVFSVVLASDPTDLTVSVCLNLTATNQTPDGSNSGGTDQAASDHATTAAASVTHTWSGGANTELAFVGFSLNGTPNGPTMTTQPQDQRVLVGSTATFTVAATTSGGPLHYQWHANGTNVGTDSASYTTPVAGLADDLTAIYCTVADDNGPTDSGHVYELVTTSAPIWPVAAVAPAWVPVQHFAVVPTGSLVASIAVTLAQAVAVGDTIVLGTCASAGVALTTQAVTDSLGNTYTQISAAQGGAIYDSFNSRAVDGWWCIVTAPGTPTITYTPDSGSTHGQQRLQGTHFTGSLATSTRRASAGQHVAHPGTGADAITTGTVNATPGDLLWAIVFDTTTGVTNTSLQASSGFSAGSNTASGIDEWETAPTAEAATFTDTARGSTSDFCLIGIAITPG